MESNTFDEAGQSTPSSSEGAEAARIPSHVLVELTSLDELTFPANSIKKLKYTCVASSARYLVLGTTTGTAYVFSRYAAKNRYRVHASVPVQVFTTRDGPICTISLSPNEEMMAIGGDSGRVTVAQINSGTPPTLLYTTAGDARRPDKVMAMAWTHDTKQVLSGHASGLVQMHRLGNKSVFRSSHEKLASFDGEVVQLDVSGQNLIISTTYAAYMYHLDNSSSQQIGKKIRSSSSVLGACFVKQQQGSEYIVAARPNGRMWESNLVGVVYRTHQFRQNQYVPRIPPVTFRGSFHARDGNHVQPDGQDIIFRELKRVTCEGETFVISVSGSRILIVSPDSSRIAILSDLEHDIVNISTSANDIFVLLNNSKGLRKFSIFESKKAIEKLNLRKLFVQSAQLIQFCGKSIKLPVDVLNATVLGLEVNGRKKENEQLLRRLRQLMEEISKNDPSTSEYDNLEQRVDGVTLAKKLVLNTKLSSKLSSGVHRVLRSTAESGYDDDFSFNAPTELHDQVKGRSSSFDGRDRRVSSSPEQASSSSSTEVVVKMIKRSSVPTSLSSNVRDDEWRRNGTPNVIEDDILHRARTILESDGRLVEKESLRTLLQLDDALKAEICFTPSVTVGNAARALAELALAVPVNMSDMWNNDSVTETEEWEIGEDGERKSKNRDSKKGRAKIVKVVLPGVKPKVTSLKEREAEKGYELSSVDQGREATAECSEVSEGKLARDEVWLDLRLSQISRGNIARSTISDDSRKSDSASTLTADVFSNQSTSYDASGNATPTEEDLKFDDENSNSLKFCAKCGMHRSWIALSLLSCVFNKVNIVKDESDIGGVPIQLSDWERILLYLTKRPADCAAICPRCETALSAAKKILVDGKRNSPTSYAQTKVNVEKIRQRCIQTSRVKLKTIISRQRNDKVNPDIDHRTSNDTVASDNTDDVERIQTQDEKGCQGKGETDFSLYGSEKHWKWLDAVDLRTMLALSFVCFGKSQILRLLEKQKNLAFHMKNDDWFTLVTVCMREHGFRSTLSTKTISSVLESVNASEWVSPQLGGIQKNPSGSPSFQHTRAQSTGVISSWIGDTNSKCPLCTLAIKMTVGGVDKGVKFYSCGHVFHVICLAGRPTIGCIACRIRTKRASAISACGGNAPRATVSPMLKRIEK